MAAGGIITSHFRIHNAMQFAESFDEPNPTRYYFYIAKSYEWNNEADPPTPSDTYQQTYYNQWRDMIAAKRIYASHVSHVVPRYDWESSTIYDQWDDTEDLMDVTTYRLPAHNYYALTDEYNVYKVIDNNGYSASTVKPTGTGTSIISTSDGYRWKYMYTITAGEIINFLTHDYMPVKTLMSDDNSSQWTVQDNAANGAINNIYISNTGSGYLTTTNTFASVINSTAMVLKSNAINVDGIYTGSAIFISSGAGSGQLRAISGYTGSTRTLVVNNAFTTTPNTSSTYYISPRVILSGDSGASLANRAIAYVSNCFAGMIRKVTIIQPGTNYSTANVVFKHNVSYGSGANAYPIISPVGGHGVDPVDELRAYNIMINVNLVGAEANSFPSNNDFRVIGIIKDPLLNNGLIANSSVIDQSTRLTVSNVSGDFRADEVITGLSTGATGHNVYFANTNGTRTRGVVRLIRETTNGTGNSFLAGETIRGSITGVTALVVSRTNPAMQSHSGAILYTENREKVERTAEQTENIKLVLKF